TSFDLPAPPEACFDHLGRAHPVTGKRLKIGPQPLYVIFARNAHPKLKAPPERAKPLSGKPSTIVMQALVPVEGRSLEKSAYFLPKGKEQKIPVFVYNFGTGTAKGKLNWVVPEGWKAEMSREVELAPMDRKELELNVTSPEDGWNAGRIRIDGD